ncbi:MAG: hypothetical protein ACLFV4_07130 [Candidatus Hydrogenedentota bacterium]
MKNIGFNGTEAGAALVAALVYIATVSMLAASFLGLTRMTGDTVAESRWREAAFYLAEAGAAQAMSELARDAAYTGDEDIELGDGRFTVAVEQAGDANWRVTSRGDIGGAGHTRARAVVEADVTRTEDGVRRTGWRRLR